MPFAPKRKTKKSSSSPPPKNVLKQYGGAAPKKAVDEGKRTAGNTETGFIQRSQKTATAAMMGRAPPPLIGGMSGPAPPTMKGKKQFKPKGKKVF